VLQPVLPSPQAYHYRSRIRLKVDPGGQPGFYRFRSNRIVPVDRCMVATELLNTALRGFQASPLSKPLAAVIREIDLLHSPTDGCIHAVFHPDPGKRLNLSLLAGYATRLTGVHAVWLRTSTGIQRIAAMALTCCARNFPRRSAVAPFHSAGSRLFFSGQCRAERAHAQPGPAPVRRNCRQTRSGSLLRCGQFFRAAALAGAHVLGWKSTATAWPGPEQCRCRRVR